MNKTDENILQIQMLGNMILRYRDKEINDQDNRSKKLWILLAYIITFRKKELSQNDFLELMWPNEESTNPGNALKTLFHRVRSMLNSLNYLSGHAMVIQSNGAYAWNNRMNFIVDVDEFENAYQKGCEVKDEEEKLKYYLSALDIYKGDFLSKISLETWVIPINTYYHSMYMRLINDTLDLLMKRERYDEVVKYCNLAISIEPYNEFLYYNLIMALVRMGNQKAALNQYESMTELFYNNFGVTPSEELTSLYKDVVRTTNSMETDLNIIKKYLREKEANPGAFYCEYEFFKNIYRLQARALARNGQSIYLGLITISDAVGDKLPLRILNNAMIKLNDSIRLSLRKGDVYAKYSVSQYIVMLPSANHENGKMIMTRITGRFRRENPHSQAIINYTLHPLDPLED